VQLCHGSFLRLARSQRYRSKRAARGAGWEIKSFAETHSEKQTRFAAKFTCAPPQKYVAAELTLRVAAN
jgi:hypothetical protein